MSTHSYATDVASHDDSAIDGAPELAAVAAAIGHRARARMLAALMGGRALTATELATEAGVGASTASSHLERLVRARLVAVVAQGRHRYFRIAGAPVAEVVEQLMGLGAAPADVRTGPRDPLLRRARVCYDHRAGERGVQLLRRVRAAQLVRDGALPTLTDAGERWLAALGVDVARLRTGQRPLVCTCIDWSERRDHLAGAVGAAILERLLALGLARRAPVARALTLDPRGEALVDTLTLPRR